MDEFANQPTGIASVFAPIHFPPSPVIVFRYAIASILVFGPPLMMIGSVYPVYMPGTDILIRVSGIQLTCVIEYTCHFCTVVCR